MRSLLRSAPSMAVLSLLGAAPGYAQVIFSVGQGGSHTSIQEAVDACPEKGCSIQLTDTAYALPREIWIEGKQNLSLHASMSLTLQGIRPRLYTLTNLFTLPGTAANPTDPQRPAGWRLWPKTCATAEGGAENKTNPYSTTGYQYNGIIVVENSRDVRIEGLHIDGRTASYFVNRGIFDCKYDVMFGNIGVNLHQSKGVTVRDNEFTNLYAALYLNNMNPGGPFAEPGGFETSTPIRPGTAVGIMGDHLIERNLFVRNWWVAYDEFEWDLGSTFRFNRALDNRNTRFTQSTDSTSEANNMAGGFLFVKDVARTPHRIHNNTIWGSPLVIGHGGYKPGVQHLIYDNIIGGFDRLSREPKLAAMIKDWRQVLSYHSAWMDRNLFEMGAADSLYQLQKYNSDAITSPEACAGQTGGSPCWVTWDTPVSVTTGIKYTWLWNGWSVQKGAPYTGIYNGTPYSVPNSMNIELFPGGGLIQTVRGVGMTSTDISSALNHWVKSLPFRSFDPSQPGFLEPAWDSAIVARTVRGQGSFYRRGTADSTRSDLGAMPPFPVVSILRSQLPLQASGTGCWSLPVQFALSAANSSARIQGVKGWAVSHSSDTRWEPPRAPRSLRLKALETTDLTYGVPVKACFDSIPAPDEDLRVQIEATEILADGGTIPLDVAYFTFPHASSSLSIGTRSTRSPLALSRVGSLLVVRGLSAAPAHLVLRSLDGRILRTVEATPVAGTIATDLHGLPRGPVAVQLRQGAETRQELTTVF